MAAMTHDEIHELLGVYALDAVDPDEAVAIASHVESCADCRAELDGYRETLGVLGVTTTQPPEGVWEGIQSQLGTAPAAPPITSLGEVRRARRPRPRRWLLAVAAIVVLLAGVATLAVLAANQQSRITNINHQLDALDANQTVARRAAVAASAPDARRVALRSHAGGELAAMVLLPDGTAYLVPTRGMGTIDTAHTYQIWGITGTQPVSLGVVGNQPAITELHIPHQFDQLAVTVERSPGAKAPTTAPIASVSLT